MSENITLTGQILLPQYGGACSHRPGLNGRHLQSGFILGCSRILCTTLGCCNVENRWAVLVFYSVQVGSAAIIPVHVAVLLASSVLQGFKVARWFGFRIFFFFEGGNRYFWRQHYFGSQNYLIGYLFTFLLSFLVIFRDDHFHWL